MTAKSASSIPHDHRLISCYEAAKLLGCTPQTIYNWIKKGKLKGHKIDNHIFVGKKAIVVLLHDHGVGSTDHFLHMGQRNVVSLMQIM